MIRIRLLRPLALGLTLAMVGAAPALCQTEIVAAPNPDADRLAEQVRALASDPRDVNALLTAGVLSARLGDVPAALAFFQRAESIDPSNPRILAGRGTALVRLERPGEALRLFQAAEARGVPMRDYAADRGFAYDLLGAPLLAQRDYTLALSGGDPDAETTRRYALSLGITGNVEGAMAQLDPLLRKSDRAAWRARAFVMAMNGDLAGAERIAARMMPGSMGQSLAPFFRRLGTLSPADRAFAVHFGELTPTPARMADARLAPALSAYVRPNAPVQVAAAARPVASAPSSRDRRSRRERERDERAVAAAAARPPVQVAAAAPPPATPPSQPIVQPLPTPAPAPSRASVQLASNALRAPEQPVRVQRSGAGDGPEWPLRFETPPADSAATGSPAPAPDAATSARVSSPSQPPLQAATTRVPQPTVATPPAAVPSQTFSAAPARSAPLPPGPARVGQEDSVLAGIVDNLTIPADELEAVARPSVDPVPVAAPSAPEPVAPKPEARPEAEPAKAREARPAPKPEVTKPEPAKAESPKPEPKKPEPKKPEAKKPDPKKPEPKKPDPKKEAAKADPARVWVQVAGGANQAALAKAWAGVVAEAPALFKGKSAWWTPLRATNRVLTGPFKSQAEAQAFVNTAAKSGVSGFVFTSEAGQKVTRIGAK